MIRIAVIMGKMNSGGKKSLVMDYYRHIDRTKVQFDFICDADSNSVPEEEILSLGGRVFIIPPYSRILSNMRAMGKILRENNYSIIHAYNSTMNLFPMFVGKLCGIPIRINESISMGHKADRKNILKTILKPFTKCFSTHYMAVGEECGRWQFGNKTYDKGLVSVFRSAIDTNEEWFSSMLRTETRKKLGLEGNLTVGHIGRITAQKNPLFLIDIFNEIQKKEPAARLLLIGDGDLREKMIDKVKKSGLDEKVIYLGRREDIKQFYCAMDCFLLPSLYEGIPVVGLESQCSGLPVFFSTQVPSESGPCSDLVSFIDLEQSPEKWAEIILNNTKSLMPSRASHSQQLKEKGFDCSLEAVRLQDYYFELLKKAGIE